MDIAFPKEWAPQTVKVVIVKEGSTNIEEQHNYYDGREVDAVKKTAEVETEADAGTGDIVGMLKGAFFGKEDVARRFLDEITNVKATQVIEIVGKYLASKDLSSLSCHRDLWCVLHENGYYEPSESNWNKAVNKL